MDLHPYDIERQNTTCHDILNKWKHLSFVDATYKRMD